MDNLNGAVRKRRSGSHVRQKQAVAAARLTEAELDQLRQAADQQGQSVSEFLRELVLKATATA